MVKPPKIRHSKLRKDPVTIDLDPAEVVRQGDANDPDAVKAKSISEVDPITDARPDDPGKESAAAASTSGQSSSAASQAFGRQSAEAASSAKAETPSDARPEAAKSDSARADAAKPDARSYGSTSTPKPPLSPAQKPRSGISGFAAGLIGGIVALALGYGLAAAGLFPGNRDGGAQASGPSAADMAALQDEIAGLKQQIAAAPVPAGPDPAIGALGGRIDGLAASIEDLKTSQPTAAADGPATAAVEALGTKVAALESSVGALSSASVQTQLDEITAKMTGLETTVADAAAKAAAGSDAAAALTSRLDGIDAKIASLGESIEGQPRMALAIAATALKAAVDRGGPFSTELETYAAVAPDAPGIDELRPLAADGVATRSEIESRTGSAAQAMIDADRPVDADAGIVDRLMTSAQSLVAVRPIGAVEGEGVPAISARIEAAVKAGDYDKALAEYETLPDPAKAAAAPFIASVEARMEADRLVDAALSGALKPAEAPAAAAPASGG